MKMSGSNTSTVDYNSAKDESIGNRFGTRSLDQGDNNHALDDILNTGFCQSHSDNGHKEVHVHLDYSSSGVIVNPILVRDLRLKEWFMSIGLQQFGKYCLANSGASWRYTKWFVSIRIQQVQGSIV